MNSPAIQPSDTKNQFSIRNLLVMTALAAVFCHFFTSNSNASMTIVLVMYFAFSILFLIAILLMFFGSLQIMFSDNRRATATSVWRSLRPILITLAIFLAGINIAWFSWHYR